MGGKTMQGIATRMEILTAINLYYEKNRFSPTVREIGNMVRLKSTSTVHNHLIILRDEWKISWNESMPRTIRVL